RELFEEARERGLFDEEELSLVTDVLREHYAAVGEARAEERWRAVLRERVPHDSDHHVPLALFSRMLTEADTGRRRSIARSLERFAPTLLSALEEGLADVEES